MLKVASSLFKFDARSVARDQFAFLVLLVVVVFFGGFAIVGFYRDALGLSFVQQWLPYILILAIISNPASYGMVFSLLLIEEIETRVRAALLVTPVSRTILILMRTPLIILTLALIGFGSTMAISTVWDVTVITAHQWALLSISTALLGPMIVISMSTIASNRVEAMALGKFYSALVNPPILLYLLPADAWYRALFLVFPTTPIVKAFDAFREGADIEAMMWLGWGWVYALVLTGLVIRHYLKKSSYEI